MRSILEEVEEEKKTVTEHILCAASALLSHLNDYSTQINYINVYILNGNDFHFEC